MLIRCPKCQTTYKVSDEAVQDAAPAFRCSRCKNVFELQAERPTEAQQDGRFPIDALPGRVQEEPELNFTFPAREQDLAARRREQFPAKISDGAAQPEEIIADERDEPWSINARAQQHEEPFTISPSLHSPPREEKIVDAPTDPRNGEPSAPAFSDTRDATTNVFPLDTFRDQGASTAPYLTLFGVLVLIFSFAAAYQQVHPSASDEVIGNIPFVGSAVLDNAHLKSGVLPKSLRGAYQTIQGNREVFVVTGEALNRNPVVIRRVQIAGQLYDQAGKAIEQQSIWVGNAISAKIVRGMSAQDVIDLQRLQPLKSFDIPPGDSVPFTIVFFKPSRAVKEFSCEVQAAESAA
jgi:predicted Zn finger-like uncharacterized protein